MKMNNGDLQRNKRSSGPQDVFFESIAEIVETIIKGLFKWIWIIVNIGFKKLFDKKCQSNQNDRIKEYYLKREENENL